MSNLRPLNSKLAKYAQDELGEVPSRIDEDIQALKDWIVKQTHFIVRIDDQFLVGFLRGCKYSLEKSKDKFDKFYALRSGMPELYRDRLVDDRKIELLRKGILLRLPKPLEEDGPRIHISRYGQYDPDENPFYKIAQLRTMLADIQLMEDDNATIRGFIEIVDMKGVGTKHFLQFDAVLIRKLSVMGEKAWPVRPKGFHFINIPKGAERFLKVTENLISEKIKKRFYIHHDYASLYEYVPKEYLPEEYGGSNGTISDIISTAEKTLLQYTAYFKEDQAYCTMEKLRSGKPLDMDSVFGLEGSFRKLEID